MKKKTIVLILSVGHSGSTLLDKAIGSHPHSFSLGEIINFNRIINNSKSLCSCGKYYSECPFWNDIISKITIKKMSNDFILDYKVKSVKNLIKFIFHYLFGLNKTYLKYIENNELLYSEIFGKTYSKLLIDSSKSIFRALLLKRFSKQFRYKIIFLVRDVYQVLNSYQKTYYKVGERKFHRPTGLPKDNTKFWFNYNLKTLLFTTVFNVDYLRVSYDNLTQNSEEELKRISEFIGLDFNIKMLELDNKINHMVWGNASRINAKIIKNIPAPNLSPYLIKHVKPHAKFLNKLLVR